MIPESEILFLEPERYELHAGPSYHFAPNRREFFQTLGCGLVVVFLVPAGVAQQESGGGRRPGRGGGQRPAEISAWLHIDENGLVTAFTGKAEVGQNIRTSLTQAVAEELCVAVATVKLVMADTQLTPYDAGTFGSQTTPQMFSQLSRISAEARTALLRLAAEKLKSAPEDLTISDGRISKNGSNESVTYGQLTQGQNLVKAVNAESKVTAAASWKTAGISLPKVDGRDFVTGRHKYASDMKLPGMLYGRVLRPAAFGATLASLDTKEAESLEGVTVVHEGNFVGVAAADPLSAARALEKIRAEWTTSPQPSSAELFDYLKKNTGGGGGRGGGAQSAGSMEEGLAAAEHKLTQAYTIAYIAHAPLEPRAAVADWKDGKLTVWTGTQRPFGARGELAEAFAIGEDRIRVIVPDTGSGYGGKHKNEAAIEASRLAKAAGKPVKLVWTREEEFTWAYFRPAGLIEINSGVRADGTLCAWEFHNYLSGSSALQTPYTVPHRRVEFHASRSPLASGSYRALAATANHFARETHMDELARVVKLDPLDFRLKNLRDARLTAVLQAATKAFGWSGRKPVEGHGCGLAIGTDKGSYLATCVEVSADAKSGEVCVLRAVTAFECGAIVNPEHLKTQIEGAMVMGIGGGLFEAIEFKDGRITNPHFSDYRVPRFADAPAIEVVLLDRKDLPSAGAGECPIVGIAPAIGNAIFDAAGIRLRSLPMIPDGLKG